MPRPPSKQGDVGAAAGEGFERSILARCPDYGLDAWWRREFKQPYGSPLHMAASPISMLVDFQDFVAFQEMKYAKVLEEYEKSEAANQDMDLEDELEILRAMGIEAYVEGGEVKTI